MSYDYDKIYILLYEFIDYIPLRSYIIATSVEDWTFEYYKWIIPQIVSAVSYCHEHFVVHGDLNIENILVNPQDKKVKIIDFGSSKQLSQESRLYSPIGNPKYRPPFEDFLNDAFFAEYWNLGLILLSLVLKERFTTKSAINFDEFIWERIEKLGLNQGLVKVMKGLLAEKIKESIVIKEMVEVLGKI